MAQAQQATAPPKGYELKQMAGSSRYEVKPEDRLDVSVLMCLADRCQSSGYSTSDYITIGK